MAVAETTVDGREVAVASIHLSWWDKGFQEEWARIEERFQSIGKPIILAGDFNNPAGREGYQTILASPLKLQDSFQVDKKQMEAIQLDLVSMVGKVMKNLYVLTMFLQARCGQ